MRWRAGRAGDRFDAGLAALLLAASLYDWAGGGLGGTYPHGRWAHVGFVVLASVPVLFRRRSPLAALVMLAVVETVWTMVLYPADVQPPLIPFVQALVVVYSAGAYADGYSSRAAVAVVVVGALTDLPSLLAGKPLGYVAGPDVMLLIAFALGLAFARVRRERASQQARATALERERDLAAARAAAEERARIARELHDVVSHDVSLMVLQASVERRANPDDPSAATLATIESTGREALVELRRMLGVLRQSEEHAPLAPQPGLAEVGLLIDQARAAGLPAELEMSPDPPALPPGLGIAAYRIVQESLTNSAKHAPGAPVRVAVRFDDTSLDIDVVNDVMTDVARRPPAAALPSGGQGLVGMRERVALFGGTLDAAPAATGGFRVHVRLPLALGGA